MSRTFFRKFFPAVPRAAGRPAFRASALRGGEFGIIRAPGDPRAGNPPAHRMPTTPARRSGRMAGGSSAWAASGWRFAPVHRHNRPGCPALARLGPPGRTAWPRLHSAAYIKGKSIGERSSVPPSGGDPSSRKERRPSPDPARLPHRPSRQPPLVDLLYVRSFPLISI